MIAGKQSPEIIFHSHNGSQGLTLLAQSPEKFTACATSAQIIRGLSEALGKYINFIEIGISDGYVSTIWIRANHTPETNLLRSVLQNATRETSQDFFRIDSTQSLEALEASLSPLKEAMGKANQHHLIGVV